MLSNDILRKVRYSLDLKDKQMVEIFHNSEPKFKEIELVHLLKKEDERGFVLCSPLLLNQFLDGLIVFYRGAPKSPPPPAPATLSNNDVLRKIRIALAYQDTDMLQVFTLGGSTISKPELSAFFRRKTHKHYKKCGDQFLRHFLQGLSLYKKRPEKAVERKTVSRTKTVWVKRKA